MHTLRSCTTLYNWQHAGCHTGRIQGSTVIVTRCQIQLQGHTLLCCHAHLCGPIAK